MFFVRRLIFVIFVIVLKDYLWGQLAMQNFVSLGMVIFLQLYKPLESNFANNIETFNEATVILMTYFLMCFTDFVPDAETRSELGNYYNGVSLGNIVVHMLIMLGGSLLAVRLRCRRSC